MVHTRRSMVGLQFTQRFARTESVAMTGAEKALYDAVAALVRDQLRAETKTTALNRMTLITLQMALGSSSAAAAAMLENLLDKPILPACPRQSLLELARRAGLQDQIANGDCQLPV